MATSLAVRRSTSMLRAPSTSSSLALRALAMNRSMNPRLINNNSNSIIRSSLSSPRFMSSYILDRASSSAASPRWPIRKTNTIFNIVPEGFKYVVERFGKMHAIEDSGWFLAIPIVDTISYVVDVRERAMDIPPQSAITRDNVAVEVSGNLFIQFVDPQKAAYGALDPLYSVTQHAQSAMRSAIGEMELDQILHGRSRLNAMIKGALQEAARPWGLEVKRYEITEIMPDPQIRSAMDKQAAAERDRRQKVLQAEGDKQRVELTSQGYKIQMQNESEGTLIKIKNEAEAAKLKLIREAEGQAEAILQTSSAQAQALRKISAELQTSSGHMAAQLALAEQYVTMYGEMAKSSNTMIFNDRPADVSALMAQAVAALKAMDAATAVPGNTKMIQTTSPATPQPTSAADGTDHAMTDNTSTENTTTTTNQETK